MVFFCFNGAFDLRLSQVYSVFQEQKTKQNNVYEEYLALSHLANGLLVFIPEFSGKPF